MVKFSRLACLAVLLTAAVATCAEPVPMTIWRITEPGWYAVSGSQIVAFQPGGPIVPPPVVPPVVPPVSKFAKDVTDAVAKIPVSDKRHEAAMKLTATYQILAGQVKDGKIHPTSAVQAAELICPIALGSEKAAWTGVFAIVNDAVGKAGTADATAAVFTAAADAILATVPAASDGDMKAAAERYGFDWDSFLAFLMELLKILLPLIISAVKVASGMVIC